MVQFTFRDLAVFLNLYVIIDLHGKSLNNLMEKGDCAKSKFSRY